MGCQTGLTICPAVVAAIPTAATRDCRAAAVAGHEPQVCGASDTLPIQTISEAVCAVFSAVAAPHSYSPNTPSGRPERPNCWGNALGRHMRRSGASSWTFRECWRSARIPVGCWGAQAGHRCGRTWKRCHPNCSSSRPTVSGPSTSVSG